MKKFDEEEMVLPLALPQGVFLTVQADNLNKQAKSSTAMEDFNGTGISVTAHVTKDNPGTYIKWPDVEPNNPHQVDKLPDSYTEIQPAFISKSQNTILDAVPSPQPATSGCLQRAINKEFMWLQDVRRVFSDGDTAQASALGWAAYHAVALVDIPVAPKSISQMLTLFKEQAHTPAMIKHVMKFSIRLTERMNPGQTPVLVLDNPLYALAKKLQWNHPDLVGENKLFIMPGSLHDEMANLAMLGSLLNGSGWTDAIEAAKVTTSLPVHQQCG